MNRRLSVFVSILNTAAQTINKNSIDGQKSELVVNHEIWEDSYES